MKFVTMLCVVVFVLAVSISTAMASSDTLSQCVMAAMHGPEKKFLKIFDHEFHCKPLQRVSVSGGGTQFTGQLSHQLRLRPDDQVYYQFIIRNGVLEKDSITRKIKDGGFDVIAGMAAAAIGAYFGVPISPQDAADFWDKAAKSVVGRGWNEVADMIVASIAMQAAAEASSPSTSGGPSTPSGKWLVSYGGTTKWQQIGSSGEKLENLRFADFNGDGKADVFHTSGGKWLVSYGGTAAWQQIGSSGEKIENLRFADFNGDGKADVFSSSLE